MKKLIIKNNRVYSYKPNKSKKDDISTSEKDNEAVDRVVLGQVKLKTSSSAPQKESIPMYKTTVTPENTQFILPNSMTSVDPKLHKFALNEGAATSSFNLLTSEDVVASGTFSVVGSPVVLALDPTLYSFPSNTTVTFGKEQETEARGDFENTITSGEEKEFKELVENSNYLQDKDFTEEEIDVFIKKLGLIPGAEKNLELLSVDNKYVNKGRYSELVRAFYLEEAGYKVEAIGKIVNTDIGKTDIDILLKDGTWIENKHVQDISADQKFKDKIDKMALAVKEGKEVNGIKIKRAIFINQGKINNNAIQYAISKGIPIFRDLAHSDAPKIVSVLPLYKDLIRIDPDIAVQCAEGAYKALLPQRNPELN